MIEYIKGDIVEIAPTQMIVECGGVGFELNISLNTYSYYNGKDSGKVYVYEVIREDAHLLYGFAEKAERELFLLLISVSGVGPNTARMILSSFSPAELVNVIVSKAEKQLTSVKGIGSKTAQRILIDLKDKVNTLGVDAGALGEKVAESVHHSAVADEAVAALVMLGFPKPVSQKTVNTILKKSPSLTVEQVIKSALRML